MSQFTGYRAVADRNEYGTQHRKTVERGGRFDDIGELKRHRIARAQATPSKTTGQGPREVRDLADGAAPWPVEGVDAKGTRLRRSERVRKQGGQ